MKSTPLIKLGCFVVALVAGSSTAVAQFNWDNWTYPSGSTATTSFTGGSVSLNVTGANSFAVQTLDDPVQYQSNFPFTQAYGDSAAAANNGTSSFKMELTFTGNTAGLVLAIGQLAHVTNFQGYVMRAFDAANNAIPLSSFGQFGNYDFGTPLNGNFLFNDNLSLNTGNGRFSVTTVAGQDNINSDMLIFSLPPGVSKIDVSLFNATSFTGDTINFMVSDPVPEPSSLALVLIGGIGGLVAWRRAQKINRSGEGLCGVRGLAVLSFGGILAVTPLTSHAATYQIDDGTADFDWGNQDPPGGDLIALNEFAVTGGNNLITSIEIAWGNPNNPDPTLNGLHYTAVLWSDGSGVGNPSGATLLMTIPNQTISGAGTNTFVTSTFSSPVFVPTSNFFVGFLITNAAGQRPAALDFSLFNSGQSFTATAPPGQGDIFNLNSNPNGVEAFDPTWMIRANAVPEPSVYVLLGIGLLFCCQRFLRHPTA